MSKKKTVNVKTLAKMKLPELQAKFAEVVGEKTRSPNKTFLIRKITEALEATDDGGTRTAKAKKPERGSPSAGTEASSRPVPTAAAEKLSKLDVPKLQARYLEVVGRSTGSTNKAYLIWKIREAKKGRIPVGPRRSAHREGVTFKVLPLRLEADLVEKLDEVRKRQGLRSRMDLFRKALQTFLASVGEKDVADSLATAN
jgi:hypothetical protein